MEYFRGLRTVEAIKTEYKRLAKLHHPDLGGDTATMQDINSQYHAALKGAHGQTTTDEVGREHTYRYSQATEQEIVDKLDELFSADILRYAEVMLIGYWIWIDGNTKPIRETLKTCGCVWHAKRLCWYWKPAGMVSRYSKTDSLGDLASRYGYKKFDKQSDERIAA